MNNRFELDQNEKGEWFLFDNRDCYCVAGPFDNEILAQTEKDRVIKMQGNKQ